MNTEEFLEHQKRIMIDAINETQNKQSTEGLRDYFAAAALQALVSRYAVNAGLIDARATAELAYVFADMMLKERERGE